MKITIRRPDGTVIEAEGTVEECERLAGQSAPPKTELKDLLEFIRESQRDPLPSLPPIPVPYHPPGIPWDPPSIPTTHPDPWTHPFPHYRFSDIPMVWKPIVTCDRITLRTDLVSGNDNVITIRDESTPVVSSYVQISSIPSDNIFLT